MNPVVIDRFSLFYGGFQALKLVSMTVRAQAITAIIGPSGCGKSTLLRSINRMNDLIGGVRTEGDIQVDGRSIYHDGFDLLVLRQRVGMVFQRPNPFPLSIFENLAYGARIRGARDRGALESLVESSLSSVSLWSELKDRLGRSALGLSLEQQQRLCIARTLAVKPEIILMDEPCSALDPLATAGIEELMRQLKQQYAIVIVTHNMQQAARVSGDTGFMLLGELMEFGPTQKLFTAPDQSVTEQYITGRFG